MTRWRRFHGITATVAICVLTAGGACAPDRIESTEGDQSAPTSGEIADASRFRLPPIISNANTYLVRVRFEPQTVPLNEPFSIEAIVLERSTGSPFDGALAADAAMPAHGHGMNTRPAVRALGPGRFIAEGMEFHMPGRWELYLDVTRDGVTERAQMDVTLE